MNERKQLFLASLVYLIYVGLITISNVLMSQSIQSNSESLEAISGIIFGFIAIPIFSIIIPFILAKKWNLVYSLWPKKKDILVVVLVNLLFIIIVNYEAINAIIDNEISLSSFSLHFISTMLFHMTYYPLFVVLLLPVLRKSIGIKPSIVITALAFAIYHFAQFHFYPSGTTLMVQGFLFCYFCASIILYLWSESLILVAVTHQISGALAMASNGSVHSEVDFLFYLTIVIMSLFFGYMIVQSIRKKDNYKEDWWLKVSSGN